MFDDMKEEREFWDTHDSTDYIDNFEETKDVVFVRPKKEAISLRLEPHVIDKLERFTGTYSCANYRLNSALIFCIISYPKEF
jgi:hypothetical protein